MNDVEFHEWMTTTIEGYVLRLDRQVQAAQKRILAARVPFEVRDVNLGLLARQRQLAAAVVCSPSSWNATLGPLATRAMIDVLLNMKWIALDPLPRSEMFINYGLGQLKLEIEHRRDALRSRADADDERYVESLEQLASSVAMATEAESQAVRDPAPWPSSRAEYGCRRDSSRIRF